MRWAARLGDLSRRDHGRDDRAHEDITIAVIAYRWGFSNASRYQQAYGVCPSDTLHQG